MPNGRQPGRKENIIWPPRPSPQRMPNKRTPDFCSRNKKGISTSQGEASQKVGLHRIANPTLDQQRPLFWNRAPTLRNSTKKPNPYRPRSLHLIKSTTSCSRSIKPTPRFILSTPLSFPEFSCPLLPSGVVKMRSWTIFGRGRCKPHSSRRTPQPPNSRLQVQHRKRRESNNRNRD